MSEPVSSAILASTSASPSRRACSGSFFARDRAVRFSDAAAFIASRSSAVKFAVSPAFAMVASFVLISRYERAAAVCFSIPDRMRAHYC